MKHKLLELHPRAAIPRRRLGVLTWAIAGAFVVMTMIWIWEVVKR